MGSKTKSAFFLKFVFFVLVTLALGTNARAEINIGPFLGYEAATSDTGTTKSSSTTTSLNLLLGYRFDFDLYLGLLYDYSAIRSVSEAGGATSTTNSRFSAYGPGLGYKSGGFFALVHYLTEPRLDVETGSITTYRGGTGLQFDIGYAFPLSSVFRLGLDLRHISYSFKKSESPSLNATIDQKLTSTDLLAAMWFEF